jgi:REP element-mobilizing transposase RayT
MHWRHVIINTHSSWLHGSPKGFRSRRHRIHSSGDYRNPPPPGEHEGLLRYQLEHSSPRVEIPPELQGALGVVLVEFFQSEEFQILSASVSHLHSHFVVELPYELPLVKAIVGKAKEHSSRYANKFLDGFRWAAGGTYKVVKNKGHLKAAVEYVATRQEQSAWSWCFQCGEPRENNRCPHNLKRSP